MGQPRLAEFGLDHVFGVRKTARRIARGEALMRDQVRRQAVIDARPLPCKRPFQVGHRLEHLIGDLDELGGILGDIAIGGDDADHRIADEADLIDRQRRKLGRLEALDRRRHAQRRGPFREFASGHHGDNTLGHARRPRVDRDDAGMGVGRADEVRIEATGHGNVVEIAALPGDKAIVLLAQQRRADAALTAHRMPPRGAAPPL